MIISGGESDFARHIRDLASRWHLGTTNPSNQNKSSSTDIHTSKETDSLVLDRNLMSKCPFARGHLQHASFPHFVDTLMQAGLRIRLIGPSIDALWTQPALYEADESSGSPISSKGHPFRKFEETNEFSKTKAYANIYR
ncbi:uncharacterized protein EAF01_009387 [Botrytis porri]|uniref:uncharacterized protein n=1 Tax=Botrytis porri TaxID=87229 RepID=UPI0019002F91|nr:uncharacterized protein EAF01_009387 [Botrytis porri]KAF7896984.1 hypothetical protein EAF01_009387 [Botrytis porri]